jgi:hypothetical protein
LLRRVTSSIAPARTPMLALETASPPRFHRPDTALMLLLPLLCFMARAVAVRDASMTAAREARVNAATLASNAAVLAAFGVGQGGSGSGNSSSSARPTAASQRHVTGEDADAGSRHDITNTSALQTGVRRGAPPPPAPADGGQSFMARAVAAREAAPRDPTMIADLIAAFTDCQDDSSSYSSSSSAS